MIDDEHASRTDIPLHVRITSEQDAAFTELCKRYGVPRAHVARRAIAIGLEALNECPDSFRQDVRVSFSTSTDVEDGSKP